MAVDPTAQVAIIGVATTTVTTIGVIAAAMFNNKRERTSSADSGVTATLRERIALKDEQIDDLREDKLRLQVRLDEILAELDRQITKNHQESVTRADKDDTQEES